MRDEDAQQHDISTMTSRRAPNTPTTSSTHHLLLRQSRKRAL